MTRWQTTIFPNSAAKFKGINANDAALLQKYFRDSMIKALTTRGYQVVEEAGLGVVRIRAAFTNAAPNNSKTNITSKKRRKE